MKTISKKVNEERQKMLASDKVRDAGIDLEPEGIIQKNNIIYNKHQQRLDVYYPAHQPVTTIIVNVHGGGWFYGNKEIYKAYCLRLAQKGFGVVNFNYRLAPEHPFPAAIDDVNDLFQWLGKWVTDEKVCVVADSAGATLALQYTTLQSNPTFGGMFLYETLPYKIAKVALYCGVYFLESSFTMTHGRLRDLRKAYLPDEIWKEYRQQLQTENYLTFAFPELMLLTGREDFLREDTYRFHQYLVDKRLAHIMKEYQSESEEVRHVFELHPHSAVSKQAMNDLVDFLVN